MTPLPKKLQKSIICAAAAFGITLLSASVVGLIRHYFPFGTNSLLYSDFASEYWPFVVELYDKLHESGSLLYSWRTGFGGPFWGSLCYYLLSPFNLILMLFPRSILAEAMGILIFLRQCFAGANMAFFLSLRKNGKPGIPAAACGVLYAFCGWFSAYYYNVIWLDVFMLLPLLALGIERLIRTGKVQLYAFALTGMLLSNFYFSWFACLFAVLYFLSFYFSNYPLLDRMTDSDGTARISFFHSRFFYAGIRFAGASVLSVAVLGILLVPLLLILGQTGENTFNDSFATLFGNLPTQFAELLSGAAANNTQKQSFLSIYSGILPLVAIPLLPFTKGIQKKEKWITFCVLFLFLLSFNLPFLDRFWHGFRSLTGLPFRESFLFSFFLITASHKVLLHLSEIPKRAYFVCGGFLFVLFLFVSVHMISANHSTSVSGPTVSGISLVLNLVLFLLLAAILFLLPTRNRMQYTTLSVLIIVLCCFDGAYNLNINIKAISEEEYKKQTDFNHVFDLITEEMDGSSFFRTDIRCTDMTYGNYGSVFACNGLYQSASVTETNYDFFRKLGMDTNESNFIANRLQSPAFNSLFGVRYVVENDNSLQKGDSPNTLSNNSSEGYTELSTNGDIRVYKYDYALPLGFSANGEIQNWMPEEHAAPENQNSFFRLACKTNNILTQIPLTFKEADASAVTIEQLENNCFAYTFKPGLNSLEQIIFSVTPEKDGLLYIYIDMHSPKSIFWNLIGVMPDDSYRKFTFDLNTALTCIGNVEAGEEYLFSFVGTPGTSSSFTLQAYMSEPKNIREAYEKLYKNGFWDLTESADTRLSGTIDVANAGQIFCTSIPASRGWHVTLDGEELPQEKILAIGGALLGFEIEQGPHEITLEYRLPGLGAGIAVSAAGVLCAAVWLLLEKKKSKKRPPAEEAGSGGDA